MLGVHLDFSFLTSLRPGWAHHGSVMLALSEVQALSKTLFVNYASITESDIPWVLSKLPDSIWISSSLATCQPPCFYSHISMMWPNSTSGSIDLLCDEEYRYILTYASDVYEALSRSSTLEPLKTKSIQDYQYWLRSIYLALLSGPFSSDVTRVIFGSLPHDGFDIVIAAICRHRGIPFYASYPLPFAPKHIILDQPQERLIWDFTQAVPFTGGSVNKSHTLQACETHITTYLSQLLDGGRYCYMQPQVIQMQTFGSILKSFRYRPSIPLLRRLCWNLLIWLKQKRFKQNLRSYTQSFLSRDDSRPYIYVPLHLQPEMSTSAMGRSLYSDQHLLFARVARVAFKYDIDVLIKENPIQSFSHRGSSFFELIDSLPNVYLVAQHESSANLICSAHGVVTVSGTAGFEACVYGVPAFCLGTSWWQAYPGVSRTIHQLEEYLKSTPIRASMPRIKTSTSEPKTFLQLISYDAWPGCQDDFYLDHFSLSCSENVNQLLLSAQLLVQHLSQRELYSLSSSYD